MKYLQNMHTHSTFCDGKDDPESTVKRAIFLGFDTIGFSSHGTMAGHYSVLRKDKIKDYQAEIYRLKEKYKDSINVYCGLEEDLYCDDFSDGFEYIIGAVHYVEKDGELVSIDVSSAESLRSKVDKYFDGDYLKVAKVYYETMCKLPAELHYKMDFVAHFDLIAKFFETADFIDQENRTYLGYAMDALRYLNDKGYPFEINTGGAARGYRTIPYPAPTILKELNRIGGRVLITSDCHNNMLLDFGFQNSLDLARETGFKEVQIFNGKEFVPKPII